MKVGDVVEPFQVKDQFDKDLSLDKNTTEIILSTTKENGLLMQEYLKNKNSDFFDSKHILYLADMTRAPSLVLSFFMLPAFKKYPYRIGLIRDEKLNKLFPKANGKISIIRLESFKILSITFIEKPDDKVFSDHPSY